MKKQFLTAILLIFCINVSAFRIEYGANVNISRPVYENLYIAGGIITINAPVYGDLVIAGGTIIINDTVANDILLAGGNVTFNGYTGGDIRCAGGNLRIIRNIRGELVVTGGTVIVEKQVVMGGLLAAGGEITIDGSVEGEIRGGFGQLVLNGNVTKNIDCRGGKININGPIGGSSILAARFIEIGPNAAFYGDVHFWNKNGAVDFKQSLKNGRAVYDPALRIRGGEWYYLGASTLAGLLLYLGMVLVMIFLIQYLFSATLNRSADTVFSSSLKSLGSGFLFFVAVPVAAIVAFITLVGIPVGLLLVFFYIILLLLAVIITSLVAANWFNNRFEKNWGYLKLVLVAFGIFIFLKLVSLTPIVGWLIMGLTACMAFGGILLNVNWKRGSSQPVTLKDSK